MGICGRDEALSVNHHLLSFSLRLKQAPLLGRSGTVKQKCSQDTVPAGMALLGLSARGNTRCSMGRHLLLESKAPLD